jgi:UDP-galactopyranose mutase
MAGPSLPDVGILALVPEPFYVPWMTRHHIMTRLSGYFPCVWVNPARHWREVLRAPFGAERSEGASPAAPPPGLSVYEPPPWLPQIHRPEGLAGLLDTARLRGARRMLLDRGCQTIVLYLWRPGFAPALDRVPHDRSLYHVEDEYSFSETEQPNSREEEALLRRVDRVFIHSPGLLEKKGGLNPRTEQIPNGVDFEAVAALRPEPDDLAAIPRPRIGYCGWVKRQLDWDLIDTLSAHRPHDSFVFVGAIAPHPELGRILERLGKRPNVHFLGARSTEELLAYPAHFDACIMPYKMDDYTKYIYPLKLHEYLAGGVPVVSTAIRTVRDFGDVVELAQTTEEWSAALDRALQPAAREPARVEARRAVARAHDWNGITHQVARAIADSVGGSTPERLEAIPVPDDWRVARFRRAE